MTNRTDFLTPVGRLIQGNPFEGQTTDAKGNPLTVKKGPNKGQPRTNYFIGIAVPKTDPTVDAFITTIKAAGRSGMPTLFDESGECLRPDFAWKFEDGDSTVPNKKGIAPCDRDGSPGNWIFKLSSGFAPKCYTAGGASILTDPESIKRGYYIRISGSVVANGDVENPGVYLNHGLVELVGYGPEIVSGPDGSQVFGNAPAAALPAGASATPVAPKTTPAPAPGPGAIAPPPTAPEPAVFNLNGQQYTRDQLVAAGWTPTQIDNLDDVPF